MGLLDNMKARLGPAKDKVSDLAQRHGGSIEQGLDRAAKAVDERTKGKYSDKINAGTGKAKEAVDRLAHRGQPGADPSPGASKGTGPGPGPGPGSAPQGGPDRTPPGGTPPQDSPPMS
ncbi:antitoxin [Streptomyces sp. NPDC047017]|uniref:antitoxin n=1 Tax=Streptomyces sp. NPDC047017 TaxID=3155024 RepID=UPI0033F93ABE